MPERQLLVGGIFVVMRNLELTSLDYLLVALYFAFAIWIGFAFKKKGERDMDAYFLSGRDLPWWLLGTSMVATTFSAGTPLLVANWAYESGIARNWEWWSFLPGAMLTTFLFARLWRRTGVRTDAEYVALRYSGREAKILRGFRALYMGFIMNGLVLGSGLVVIAKIGTTLLGVPPEAENFQLYRWGIALICGLVALFYSALSGLAGIVITDFVQFTIAMLGSLLIAAYACAQPKVGGLSGLVAHIKGLSPGHLNLLPTSEAAGLTVLALGLFLTMRWWSQVYGGAEPGGASHVAQRMLSARSERDALLGTLWFNLAHYAVRPWPWIIAGLAALVLFPEAGDGERAYVMAIDFLPFGLKGLVLAAFFAAFMSTIDTRLNLGAAYFVNDFYRPFLVRDRSERHYILISRLITLFQMLGAYAFLLIASSMKSVFFLYTAIGSGSGLVYILRWYWWRVNAWSEIAAMTAALAGMLVFRIFVYPTEETFNEHGVEVLVYSTLIVTLVWLVVTFLTPPTSRERLKEFYRQVRPAGPFWKPIVEEVRAEGEEVPPGYSVPWCLVAWVFATLLVLSILFSAGKFLLGEPVGGGFYFALAVVSWGVLQRVFARKGAI